MALDGMIGNGIKVAYSNASPVSWVRVTQLDAITTPQFSSDVIDRTVSGTNRFKRSLPGMATVSPLQLVILGDLDSATSPVQAALLALWKTGETIYWRVEIPINRSQTSFRPMEFRGYVKDFQYAAPIDDKQTLTVSIEFDDEDVYLLAPGASAIT